MENSPDFQQDLNNLGIKDLKELGVEELQHLLDTVDIKVLHSINLLRVFLGWLFARLSNLDLSDSEQITAWCEAVESHGFLKDKVIDAYRLWQVEAGKIDPPSARRFEIVASEISQLLPSAPYWMIRGKQAVIVRPASDPKEVIEIASNTSSSSSVEFIGCDDSNSQHKSNTFSLDTQGSTLQTAIFVEENDPCNQYDNMGKKQEKGSPKPVSGKPMGNYICNRCNQPGHFLQHCPTNLDPAYDMRPPDDYICNCCTIQGDHFITTCPKNKNPQSWTQLRRQAAKQRYRPSASREGEENSVQTYRGSFKRGSSHDLGQNSPIFNADGCGRRGEASLSPAGQNTALPIPSRDNMGGYIHESRRELVDFHPYSDGPPTRGQHSADGRMVKRLRTMVIDDHDKDHHMTETNDHHRALILRHNQEYHEGRLSYHDMGDDSERQATESEPPLGWSHALSLGYTKDHERDAQNFLDNLAEELFERDAAAGPNVAKGRQPHETALPRANTGRDSAIAETANPVDSDTSMPDTAVTALLKDQPKVCIDLTEADDEEPVNPNSNILKLFPNTQGLLTPRRPPARRATAMDMWERVDQEKANENQSSESRLPHNSTTLQGQIMGSESAEPNEEATEMQDLSYH